MFLAIFDKMFCRYVAKVYTKQNNSRKLAHCGVDGKFRHFEQDAEYKLQLNLNHGLKFPLTNGSLYGRLHTHQNRARTGTITMGIQHYPRIQSLNDDNNYGSLPAELTSFTSSTFEPRQHKSDKPTFISVDDQQHQQQQSPQHQQQSIQRLIKLNENFEFSIRRKIGSTDVFGQNMENLVQLEEPKRKFTKSLDEIREEDCPKKQLRNTITLNGIKREKLRNNTIQKEEQEFTRNLVRRNQSFDCTKYPRLALDCRTYDVKDLIRKDRSMDSKREIFEQDVVYETSDDESCDYDNEDFNDTMSSCKSQSRSCYSVTTVANDDFEFFQQKGTKVDFIPTKKLNEVKINMRTFTPKIIDNNWLNERDSQNKVDSDKNNLITKPTIHRCHLKKIAPGFSMNDLDKLYPAKHQSNSAMINCKNYNFSYCLNNSNVCRQNIGGSAPDLNKIFITELI